MNRTSVVLLLLGVVLVVGGLWAVNFVLNYQIPTKEEVRIPIWVPNNVELRGKSEVAPGTFSIFTSFEEFQQITAQRPDQKALVVYDTYSNYGLLSVIYWLPDTGGVFYRATKVIERPPVTSSVWLAGQQITFEKKSASYVFKDVKSPYKVFVFVVVGALVGVAGFCLVGGVGYSTIKTRRAKI